MNSCKTGFLTAIQTSATPDTSAAVCKTLPEVQIGKTKVKSGRVAAFETHLAGLINYSLTISVHTSAHKMYIISFCWSPWGPGPLSARHGWYTKGVFLSQGAITTALWRQRQNQGPSPKAQEGRWR